MWADDPDKAVGPLATDDARKAWQSIKDCSSQVRFREHICIGLDLTSVILFVKETGRASGLFFECLPAFETFIVSAYNRKSD